MKNERETTEVELTQSDRFKLLKKHWATLDSAWLNNVYKELYNLDYYETYISLIVGLMPSAILTEDEFDNFSNINKLMPPDLRNNFVRTSNSFLYDKRAVKSIVLQNQEHFKNFDIKEINNDIYMKDYIENLYLSFSSGIQENIQVGLILGFPIASTIAYANDMTDQIEVFHNFGYQLLITSGDRPLFYEYLKNKYNSLGITTYLNEQLAKWKKEFKEFLNTYEDLVQILKIDNQFVLEIKSSNINDEKFITELLLISSEALKPKEMYSIFLNIFAQRYNHGDLDSGDNMGLIGIDFERHLDFIIKNHSESKFIYIRMEETFNIVYDPIIKTINKELLIEWVDAFDKKVAQQLRDICKK